MLKVVMIIGPTGIGKSRLVQEYTSKGFVRLNRDEVGGRVSNLIPAIHVTLKSGNPIVLDNTHLTVTDRADFIAAAKKENVPIEAIYLDTSKEDAQVNIIGRLMGLGYDPMDLDAINASKHPNVFSSAVHFKHFKLFEKPTKEEGFDRVEKVHFERLPQSAEYRNKALILDYDGTLRKTKSGNKYPTTPDDIEILPGRSDVLQRFQSDGWLLLGASNQSGVAHHNPTMAVAKECFQKTNDLLGVDIEFEFCPHKSGPIICWCRKPMPGIGIHFIEKHKLDKGQTIMIGDMKTDETFANRVGIQYRDAEDFFSGGGKI